MKKKPQYNEEDVNALEHVSMLIDEYMCCDDDKLTDSGKALKDLVEDFYSQWEGMIERYVFKYKSKMQSLKEYVNERTADEWKVPEFEEGYVVIDVTDNHILNNKIFMDKEDAKCYMRAYLEEIPSLVENSYDVMKVTRGCIQYGAFPYEKQLYFIYDLER